MILELSAMPGLYGYYSSQRPLGDAIAHSMARALRSGVERHESRCEEDSVCIGAVDHGIFPGSGRIVASRDGSRRMCFLGEILNDAVEESDTSSAELARRYLCEVLDREALATVGGSFSAAIVDRKRGTLELVTDNQGSYPIYYACLSDCFLFATQQKALLACGMISPRIDVLAVSEMLQLGFVWGEHTLVEGVHLMPPGATLSVSARGITIERYTSTEFSPDRDADRDEAIEELGRTLTRAVRSTFRSGLRIGVPLSGGLDSRALLALAPEPDRVPSFTFGTESSRDLRFGREIAQALGSSHDSLPAGSEKMAEVLERGVWLTEGLLGATHFHILPHVSEFAKRCDVVLNGIGGDVLIGGKYVKEPWLSASDPNGAISGIWDWLASQVPQEWLAGAGGAMMPSDVHVEARDRFRDLYLETHGRSPMDKAMTFLLENRTRRFIGMGTELLRWRTESHQPFLDPRFIRAVANVPHRWRKRQRIYVDVLKLITPLAARARWQHTGLPVSVPFWISWSAMATHKCVDSICGSIGLRTPFSGRATSDFASWFRGSMRSTVSDVLLSPRALDRGVFSPDFVRRAVVTHMDGRRDLSQLLGVLLVIEMFCRLCLEDMDDSIRRYTSPKEAVMQSAGGT